MREDNRGQRRSFGGSGRQGGFHGGGRGFGGRDNRGPRRSFSSGPREMQKATCTECNNECEVPFKPTEGKPVFCNECFAKHKPKRF